MSMKKENFPYRSTGIIIVVIITTLATLAIMSSLQGEVLGFLIGAWLLLFAPGYLMCILFYKEKDFFHAIPLILITSICVNMMIGSIIFFLLPFSYTTLVLGVEIGVLALSVIALIRIRKGEKYSPYLHTWKTQILNSIRQEKRVLLVVSISLILFLVAVFATTPNNEWAEMRILSTGSGTSETSLESGSPYSIDLQIISHAHAGKTYVLYVFPLDRNNTIQNVSLNDTLEIWSNSSYSIELFLEPENSENITINFIPMELDVDRVTFSLEGKNEETITLVHRINVT